jgi:hypothetical protein
MCLIEFQNKFTIRKAFQEVLCGSWWSEAYRYNRYGQNQAYFHAIFNFYQCKAFKTELLSLSALSFIRKNTLKKWFWMIFIIGRQKRDILMLSVQKMLELKRYRKL